MYISLTLVVQNKYQQASPEPQKILSQFPKPQVKNLKVEARGTKTPLEERENFKILHAKFVLKRSAGFMIQWSGKILTVNLSHTFLAANLKFE